MKMTKRFLPVLAVILCLVFAFSVVAVADVYAQRIQWYLDDNGVLTITGSGAMSNFTAKSTGEWLTMKDLITTVVIEEGVTTVGNYAFTGCTNLQSVCIPESVTTIGSYAFNGCYALQSVYFAGYSSSFSGNPFSTKPTIYCYEHAWVDYWANNQSCAVVYLDAVNERDLVIMTLASAQKLGVGESRTISYQLFPACWRSNITWRVSNSTIASIDQDGTLTGRRAGTVRVTATVAGRAYTTDVQVINGYTSYSNYAYKNELVIQIQPTAQSVTEGQTAIFTVGATGDGILYQWQERTANGLWKASTASGATTATLQVTATRAMNATQYRCRLMDVYGTAAISNAVTLAVKTRTALVINTQPKDQTGRNNTVVQFSVDATGTELTYQWQECAPGGMWQNSVERGNNTRTLNVVATNYKHGYKYRCIVYDNTGSSLITNAATLSLQSVTSVPTAAPRLTITRQPSSVSTRSGSMAQFTVSASGTGLVYRWLESTSNGYINSSEYGFNTATLTVNATDSKNGRRYCCVVTDSYGNKVTSAAATLTVQAQPTAAPLPGGLVITSQPYDVSGAAGTSVQFQIQASGSGLRYQWQMKPVGGSWRNSHDNGNNTPVLTYRASQAANGYQFRCVVIDSSGNGIVSKAVTLVVR